MRAYIVFIICLSQMFQLHSFAQAIECSDSAFAKAKQEGKPVLLLFTGSDWCPNCIRFDKKIMHEAIFKDYLASHLITFTVDFPQQKKLPAAIVKQNEMLAEVYNREGAFPKIVLIDPAKPGQYRQVVYTAQTAVEFISDMGKLLPAVINHE